MSDKVVRASLDLPLPDSGTGTATLSFVDAAGLSGAVLPPGSATVWTSSDPTVISVAGNADNVTAAFGPATPVKLGTGIVISSATTLPAVGAAAPVVISASGQPIDVIAGGPAGAQMVESVN
jgi:hypothetical protein